MNPKRREMHFLDIVMDLGAGAAAIVILFTMFAVIYEVVMRYFLNRPTSWVLEVVEWCQVWMTFLGAAWVLKENSHVAIDAVPSRLKPKARIVLEVATSSIGALICLAMAWFGSEVVVDHFYRRIVEATLLRAPKGPLLLIIPLGFFLMFVQFLRRIAGLLKRR